MDQEKESFDTLQDIKRIMERSSRFISLSGWSGVSAGICALIGAWLAYREMYIATHSMAYIYLVEDHTPLLVRLIVIAVATFVAAFSSALIFTAIRSKKEQVLLWGKATTRLLWNVFIPLFVGGIFLLRMLMLHQYQWLGPGCLLFYGLALVNASKYTLGEVRFLGYAQLVLGIINLWFTSYDLFFWAFGFGVLHIIYGIIMWWKYEKKKS